jgi:hypothetical protein
MAAVIRWRQGRPAGSLDHLDAAEEIVATGGVDLSRSLAFSPPTRIGALRGLTLWLVGRRAEAVEAMDGALAAAEEVGLGAAGFARRWALVLALMDGDEERVRALLSRPLREASWERFRYPSAVVAFAEGWLRYRAGERAGGLAAMREAHAVLVAQGMAGAGTVFLGLLAEAALAAGQPREAVAFCEAGLAITELGERYWSPQLERLLAAARRAAGG